MVEITDYDKFYFKYEYDVASKYLIPLLIGWGVPLLNSHMLDVGCGDGGGIAAFHDAGMSCKGFDTETRRIELAQAMMEKRGITLRVGDIFINPLPFGYERFDLVVLHDVFEHLERKKEVLSILKSYLTGSGKLLITFPPFYSAFGGHQQLMKTWFARLPFVHLVPFMVSYILPRLKKEHKQFVDEISKLSGFRMGMKKFELLVSETDFKIERSQNYIISPNHIRFGLKPISGNIAAKIPLLRELFISGAIYLLSLKQEK